MRYLIIHSIFLCFTVCLNAQSGGAYFKQAQQFVSSQQLDSAITAINMACRAEETNLDYRLYRARINALKHDFETSFLEIDYILQKNPYFKEAELLRMDNYLAQKKWEKQDSFATTSLSSTKQKQTLKDSINTVNFNKTIFAHYTHFQLNTDQPDWNIYELEYIHRLKKLTYSVALNRAYRFNTVGNQALIQLYPRIGKRAYAWLIGGVSDEKTYPKYVYGASFFLFALKNIELETGMRSIKLSDNPTVKILRGGIIFDNAVHRIGYNMAHVNSKTDKGLT